jgi:endo-1,3(4)-beta-glucanase
MQSIFIGLNTSNYPAATPVSDAADVPTAAQITDLPEESLNPEFQPAIKVLSGNVFAPIAINHPPPQFTVRNDHPQKGVGIKETKRPFHTNKFYSNLFVGSQKSYIWTHPYSLQFTGNGIAVSHIERSQTIYGPGNPPSWFSNPLYIRSMILSANELGNDAQLTTTDLGSFSVTASLTSPSYGRRLVSFPIVQGQGFVTGIYHNSKPLIRSEVFFKSLVSAGRTPLGGTYKYRAVLGDSTNWLIYVTPDGTSGTPPLLLQNSSNILGPDNFSGSIQVAKLPSASSESIYDKSAGTYARSASLSASANGVSGTYTLSWRAGGLTNRYLLMFALPHHLESMHSASANALTSLSLQTTTKGMARALLANQMTLVENRLPVDIGFGPWSADGKVHNIPQAASRLISRTASIELTQDMNKAIRDTENYWNAKALTKYAMLIWATYEIGQNRSLATYGLNQLKDVFQTYVDNRQPTPYVYDSYWGGVTSSASYGGGNPQADFGSTSYNDHHFHFGYLVYTAAIIAYMDAGWLSRGTNKAWVDSLVRDYANPVPDDPYFPFSRAFDWYHGHSWASGLFEFSDGKNEESTSEDAMSLLAMKMWGKVTGDANMEARGNLHLAVLKRSLRNYFLMESTNKNQPPSFVANVNPGIVSSCPVYNAEWLMK